MFDNPVEEFRAAAAAYGSGEDAGDQRRASLAFYDKVGAVRRLRKLPDQGRAALTLLLDDPDVHVRFSAARFLLPLEETRAVGALEAIAASTPTMTGLCAEVTLEQWRAGGLRHEV